MPAELAAPSVGYLVPTRDAVARHRPAARPLLRLGERAEALGFDAVWVGDSPLARPRHDALAMLAALAARTDRVWLGTAVMLAALRHPLLLAQAAATIDQLAEGRLILGLGAGFPYPETERQFAALRVPYHGRVVRMVETIEALRVLWRAAGEPITFTGKRVTLDGVALEPPPHRTGGPPIWLAGMGDAAERRIGQLADGWLPYPPTPQAYAESWARIAEHAAAAGRPAPPVAGLYATVAIDPSTHTAQSRLRVNVERYYQQPLELMSQIQAMFAGTPDEAAGWLDSYLDAGARHVVLRVADDQPERGLEAAAQVRELLVSPEVLGSPR